MNPTDVFEAERKRLIRLAYRMLSSVSEAEDVVQDAWLRWSRVDTGEVGDARAYLVRIVTRLSLDRLRSARARRETYVGAWLPEPLVEEASVAAEDRADDVSVAFLLALERLSPLERAVFLLHDVFDQDYAQISAILDRSEPACRQLAARARTHVADSRPRFAIDPERAGRVREAFMTALAKGDVTPLSNLLAEDAVLVTDGGGKRQAALNPILGRDKITRFYEGVIRKTGPLPGAEGHAVLVNGLAGLLVTAPDGIQSVAFDLDEEGRITALYVVRNPDKLTHLLPH
jgi:RNA polymerase sigma-70 factor (ECF subfamily)